MNENVVGDCKFDQFYQIKVYRERDEDCAIMFVVGSESILVLHFCLVSVSKLIVIY